MKSSALNGLRRRDSFRAMRGAKDRLICALGGGPPADSGAACLRSDDTADTCEAQRARWLRDVTGSTSPTADDRCAGSACCILRCDALKRAHSETRAEWRSSPDTKAARACGPNARSTFAGSDGRSAYLRKHSVSRSRSR
jgi:hypothetical protein